MGYDGENLATTGAFGLTVFGTHIGLDWVVGAAVTVILLGALLYRLAGWRHA